jgi:hypothetical protein
MGKRLDSIFGRLHHIPYLEVLCSLTVLKLSWSAISDYSSVGTLLVEVVFILALAILLARFIRSSHMLLKACIVLFILAVWAVSITNVDWRTAHF